MNVYFLVDNESVVRCIASHESNLHKDKLLVMTKYEGEMKGRIGDEYDPILDEWTPRPENYPPESNESKIQNEIHKENRKGAVQRLKAKGDLPNDYIDG